MLNKYLLTETGIRPWGTWECICVGEKYIVKRIVVNPQSSLSLQSHNHRHEHWFIVDGTATITIDDKKITCSRYESVDIPMQSKHRMGNLTDKPVVFIEIQTGDIFDENDIIRYEDIYNRV